MQNSRSNKVRRVTAYVAGGLFIVLGLIGFLGQFNDGAASSSVIFGYVLATVFVIWGTLLCLAVRFHYCGGIWSLVGITLVALATIHAAFMYDVDLPRRPFISPIRGLLFIITCALMGCCCLVVGHMRHQKRRIDHDAA
jgi:peptidoglycan/LPS O-acetylase OafA/YrhL